MSDYREKVAKVEKRILSHRDEQERIQKKTFTNWINTYLCQLDPPRKLTDLFHDLKDGILLIYLLEVLSGESLPKENRKVMQRVHHITNVRTALEFLEKRQIKLVNINPTDIVDGKPAIVLGLIWTIILYFQIEEQEDFLLEALGMNSETEKVKGAGRKALLAWVEKNLSGNYSIEVKDFGASWRDGRAFNALVHNIDPSLVDMDLVMKRSNRENLEHAFDAAEKHLGLPKILDPEDVDVDKPDEKSIMTYVTQFLKKYPEGGKDVEGLIERRKSRVQATGAPGQKAATAAEGDSVDNRGKDPEALEAETQRHLMRMLETFIDKVATSVPPGQGPLTDTQNQFEMHEPILNDLVKKQADGLLRGVSGDELENLQKSWQTTKEQLQQWKWRIDGGLTGDVGVVCYWLAEAEQVLYSPLPQDLPTAQMAQAFTSRLQAHKKTFINSDSIREKLNEVKSKPPPGMSNAHLEDIEQRLNKVQQDEPGLYRKLDFAENRYRLHSNLLQAQEKMSLWNGPKFGEAVEVTVLLQDLQTTVNRDKMVENLIKLMGQFSRKAETFTQKDIAGDEKACEEIQKFVSEMKSGVDTVTKKVPEAEGLLQALDTTWQTWNNVSEEIKHWLDETEQALNKSINGEDVSEDYQITKLGINKKLNGLETPVKRLLANSKADVAERVNSTYEELKERFQSLDVEMDEVISQQKVKAQRAARAAAEEKHREEQNRLAAEEKRKQEEEEKRQRELAEERHRQQEAEERRREAERLAEEMRLAEEKREEEERLAEEKRKEEQRLAEVRHKQEEEERKRKAEEERRLAEEKRKAEEEETARRKAEEEHQRRLADERRREEEERARVQAQQEAHKRTLREGDTAVLNWIKAVQNLLSKNVPSETEALKDLLKDLKNVEKDRQPMADELQNMKLAARGLPAEDAPDLRETEQEFKAMFTALPERIEALTRLLPILDNIAADAKELQNWVAAGEALVAQLQKEEDPIKAAKLREQLRRHLQEAPHQKKTLDALKRQLSELEKQNPGNVNDEALIKHLNDLETRINDLAKSGGDSNEDLAKYEASMQKARAGLQRLGELIKAIEDVNNDPRLTPEQKLAKLNELKREMQNVENEVEEAIRASKKAMSRASPGERKLIEDDVKEMEAQLNGCRDQVNALSDALQSQKEAQASMEADQNALEREMAQLEKTLRKMPPAEDDKQLKEQIGVLQNLLGDIEKAASRAVTHSNRVKGAGTPSLNKMADSLKADLDTLLKDAKTALKEKEVSSADLTNFQKNSDDLEEHLQRGKSLKQRIGALKKSKSDLQEKANLLEALKAEAQEVEKGLSTSRGLVEPAGKALSNSGRDKLRHGLREAERESAALFDTVDAEINELERSKKQYGEAARELERVKAQLHEIEGCWPKLKAKLESPGDSVAENKTALEQVQALEEELQALTAPLQRLEDGTFDDDVLEDIAAVKGAKNKLQREIKQSQDSMGNFNNALQKFVRDQEKFQQWLHASEERLAECSSLEGDRQAVQSRLNRLQSMAKVKNEGAVWLQELDELAAECKKSVQPEHARFQALCEQLQGTTAQLENMKGQWATFEDLFGDCQSALRTFESALLQVESASGSGGSGKESQKLLPSARSLLQDIKGKADDISHTAACASELVQKSHDPYDLRRAEQLQVQRNALEKQCSDLVKSLEDGISAQNSLVSSQKKAELLANDFMKGVAGLEESGVRATPEQLEKAERDCEATLNEINNCKSMFERMRLNLCGGDRDAMHAENHRLEAIFERGQQRLARVRATMNERNLQEGNVLKDLDGLNSSLEKISTRLKSEVEPLTDLGIKKARCDQLRATENEFQFSVTLPLKRLTDRSLSTLSPDTQAKVKQAELNAETLKTHLALLMNNCDGDFQMHETLDRLMNAWKGDLNFCSDKVNSLASGVGSKAPQDQAYFDEARIQLTELERRLIAMKPLLENVLNSTAASGKTEIERQFADMRAALSQQQETLKSAEQKFHSHKKEADSLNIQFKHVEDKLRDIQRALSENALLKATLDEKRDVCANHQRMVEELQAVSEKLQEAAMMAERFAKQNGEADFAVASLLTALQTRYESAKEQSDSSQIKFLQNVRDHEKMDSEYRAVDEWLMGKEMMLNELRKSSGNSPEHVLEVVDKIFKVRDEGQRAVQNFISQADHVTLATSPKGRENIVQAINSVEDRWRLLLQELMQRKSQVEDEIHQEKESLEAFARINNWLQEKGAAVKSLQDPILGLRDIHGRLQQWRNLDDEVKGYGLTINRFLPRLFAQSSQLRSRGESVLSDYEKLEKSLRDARSVLEKQSQEHMKFQDQLRDMLYWFKVQRGSLASMRDTPNDVPQQEVTLKALESLWENVLPVGKKRLADLQEVANSIADECSLEGKKQLQDDCERMNDELKKFQRDVEDCITTQKEAIQTSKNFVNSCERIKEMLRLIENVLKSSPELYATLPDKKQALDECSQTVKTLQELHPDVDSVSSKASEVTQLMPDALISREVSNINSLYQRLLVLAREKEKLLQSHVGVHTVCLNLLEDMDGFLHAQRKKNEDIEATLAAPGQRNSRTLEVALGQVNTLERELEAKRSALQHLIHTGEHVKATTATVGIPLVQRSIEQAKQEHSDLLNALTARRSWIHQNMSGFHEFDRECETVRLWLSDTSARWVSDSSENMKSSLSTKRGLIVELRSLKEECERKGFECERLQSKAQEMGSSECKEVAGELYRHQQQVMDQLNSCLNALQKSISGEEEYRKARCELTDCLADVQTQLNHLSDTSSLSEKELPVRAAKFPPLIERLTSDGEKLLNTVLTFAEQVISSRSSNSAQIAQEVDNSQMEFTRLQENLRKCQQDFSQLSQLCKEYRIGAERFRNWLTAATTRQTHTAARMADLLECQTVFSQHQTLYDEIVGHRGDLDHLEELANDLLTKWFDPAVRTQMTDLTSSYETVLARSRDLNRRMEELNHLYQAYQRAQRNTQRWMEAAVQKLLKCSDYTGKTSDLEERLRVVKDVLNSMEDGQDKLLTAQDAGDQLIKLLTASQTTSQPFNGQCEEQGNKLSEVDLITSQLDSLHSDWNALTKQVSTVILGLEKALGHWNSYEELKDRLAQWLEEMDRAIERAEAQIPTVEEGDHTAHKACCEKYKALKKEADRMNAEFQQLQQTCDELVSVTPNTFVDRENQELQGHFHNLVTRLRMRINSLEHVDRLLSDYQKALEECEKWIIQTQFRLLNASSTSPHFSDGDAQHFACWDLAQADLHKEVMSAEVHEPVNVHTVKQLQLQLAENAMLSEEIQSKAHAVKHIKTLGETLLQTNEALLSQPNLNVSDQLHKLQESYDELCKTDQKIQDRLEETVLHVMDQFLNGELANWWLNTQPTARSDNLHLASSLNSSSASILGIRAVNVDSRQLDTENMLRKMVDLWDVVKPYALKHNKGAKYGLPVSHLCVLGDKLLEQTPKEMERLKQLSANLKKLRDSLGVYENMKTDFSDWLLGKQKEWSNCRIQISSPEGVNTESRDNLCRVIKNLVSDIESRQCDLDTLEQLHKALGDGGILEDATDPKLLQLAEDHRWIKSSLQEALERLEREAREDDIQKQRAQKLEAGRKFHNGANSKTVQTSQQSSDSEEFGLRNSGGNRGISKQFWPYSDINGAHERPVKGSKSEDDVRKAAAFTGASSGSPHRRNYHSQAIRQLLSTVKNMRRGQYGDQDPTFSPQQRSSSAQPTHSPTYLSQPTSPSSRTPPYTPLGSESVRRNGPVSHRAGPDYQPPIIRSSYPNTRVPTEYPLTHGSNIHTPLASPGLNPMSSLWRSRPSAGDDLSPAAHRNPYPNNHHLPGPPSPSMMFGIRSRLGPTSTRSTAEFSPTPGMSIADMRKSFPDQDRLWISLEKAAESAHDLHKISENMKQLTT